MFVQGTSYSYPLLCILVLNRKGVGKRKATCEECQTKAICEECHVVLGNSKQQ